MMRLGLYITLAILLAYSAVWFADNPGQLQVNWNGWEIRMSMAIYTLIILFYTALCWYLFNLYRWFKTDNPLMSKQRIASRREKGLAELDLGWSALAVHDKIAAIKHGKKAHSLLPDDNGPLRLLLKSSDDEKYLNDLGSNANTKMIALRFRLEQKLKDHNDRDAYDILSEMQNISPENPWILKELFGILTHLNKWPDAIQTLNKLVKNKILDKGEQKRLSAVLCYCQALEADLAGQKKAARDFVEQALKNDSGFIAAALLLGRLHLSQSDKARARKVVENIWKVAPHPDLAQFFLKLEPLESPSEKFRRTQNFARLNADHPHSLHLLAVVALDTEHWVDAKQSLEKLTNSKLATRETYNLLARLEILQKQDEKTSDAYVIKGENAADDPAWHCNNCHNITRNYATICPKCHTFGQITWQ